MTAKRQALIAWTITGMALLALIGPPLLAQTNVANSAADLAGKILMVADSATGRTVTNLFTFDRGAAVPFAVGATSLKVTNLDADKLDGIDGATFATLTGSQTLTNKSLTSPTVTGTLAGATSTWSGTVTSTGTVFPLGLVDASGASAGQFKFPAAQNASSDVNTLDDFEEGTFTPTIIGSTSGAATYTAQAGFYTKIGKRVFFNLYIGTATAGTLVGNIRVGGLPFASQNTSFNHAGMVVSYFTGLGSNVVYMSGYTPPNTQYVELYKMAAAAASVANVVTADIGSTDFIIGGSYQAAN